MYYGLGGISQMLRVILQLKQLEQLTSSLQETHANERSCGDSSTGQGSAEDPEAAREKLRLQTLKESYEAYGEYCKLMGLEPSREGYELWYAENRGDRE